MELTHEDILNLLPDRNPNSHKGNYGKILLLCGSRGYTGAAALAAMGALRSGAGLVYLGVPECIYTIEAVKLNEAIVFPLPERNGMVSVDALSQILELLPKMDAVLIGCGFGCSDDTFCILQSVLREFSGPIVVDADGINMLAGHIDILRGRAGITILTPHDIEFKRAGGMLTENRIASAMSFAKNANSIVLLKGNRTIITDGAEVYINSTGNAGMAVGGSGDLLAGIIISLLGQGLAPLSATACGAWLHGAAGDICAKEIGQYGMLPTDMLQVLPRLLK